MTLDPESTALLIQAMEAAKREANGMDATVTTDGQTVDGTLSVRHGGDHWWVRAWAAVRGERGRKPQGGAGVTAGVRWLMGKK